MNNQRGFQVRALGEIAIRCRDIGPMFKFYRDMIGLEVLSGDERDEIVFFKISEGFAGHTSVLALFAEPDSFQGVDSKNTIAHSTLHHFALSISFAEQDAATKWFEKNELEFEVREFDWIGWRGVFSRDPEGNIVELVAKDPNWVANRL